MPGMLRSVCPDLADYEVFIAGAPGFVRACAAAAEGLGTLRAHVKTEEFFFEPR